MVRDAVRERGFLGVCIREYQRTLRDSAKRLIEGKLAKLGLGDSCGFRAYEDRIKGDVGYVPYMGKTQADISPKTQWAGVVRTSIARDEGSGNRGPVGTAVATPATAPCQYDGGSVEPARGGRKMANQTPLLLIVPEGADRRAPQRTYRARVIPSSRSTSREKCPKRPPHPEKKPPREDPGAARLEWCWRTTVRWGR